MKHDPRTLGKLRNAFERLRVPVALLWPDGDILLPSDHHGIDPAFAEVVWDDDVGRANGHTYARIPPSGLTVRVPGMDDAAFDRALLAAELVAAAIKRSPARSSREEVFRRALAEKLKGPELLALAGEYRIDVTQERCCILFHSENGAETIARMLESIFPRNGNDAVIELDRHSVVLVKTMDEEAEFSELETLAYAIEDSVQSEGGLRVLSGIGDPRVGLDNLEDSLQEARLAIEIGRPYRSSGVFVFRNMLLERFLHDVPRDVRDRYHAILFDARNARLLGDEMLLTIDTFFRCNLNLSETARQLYIHRNTLVYRLDKFQRATGLDLRQFDHAVTFRMMMLMGNRVIERD